MPTQARLRKRNKEIVRKILAGKTYKELARTCGVGEERIRQIINKEGHSSAEIFKKKRQQQHDKKLKESEKLAEKLGRLPTTDEMMKHLKICEARYTAILKHLREKGITRTIYDERGERKRREMLRYLARFAKRLGHTPTSSEINGAGKYHQVNFHNYFGSLTEAQRLAGLKPNKPGAQKGNINARRQISAS